ncbi:unnamed protein product [Leptosia nina]|uniref:Luciferin 4-monooxygenase n=1 Tax=Leptosia nina TaxID=320188 RepID=A0AAV1IT02_9NEOP
MFFSDEYKDGVFYGDQNFSIPYHMNYGAFVLEKFLKYKDKVALINGDTNEQITFGDLAQKIVNTTTFLTQLGVQTEDVVAVCSENRIEFLIAACAVFCVGATVTFLNISYGENEMNHAVNISKPKYIFLSGSASDSHYENLKKHNMIRKYIFFDNPPAKQQNVISFRDLADENIDLKSFKPVHFQGRIMTCMILYSSGTTGPAKGAKLSNLNYIIASQQPQPTERDLTMLTIAPWCSTMGIVTTLQGLIFGKKIVYQSRFNERAYLRAIEKYKVGYAIVAPPVLVILCKSKVANEYDLSSLEVVTSGGATTNIEVLNELKARYPSIKCVIQGYGMTEATGAVTNDFEKSFKEGSVGKPVPGIIAKIVDPDSGKVLGCREPGEVCIKGPVLFEGYIGMDLDKDLYPGGFYRTGDIGYYDEDGYFYIVDRIKELIKYNAWQVSPTEIEAILLKHKDVKDAGVTGTPDQLAGELPTALIVRQQNSQITEKDVIEFVDTKVAPWKKLRGGVIFVDEIPKNPSGKILRRKLKELISESRTRKVTSKL